MCQQIEEIAKTKQGQTLDKASTKIEMDDLPKFDAIFYDFYDKAVLQLPQDQQKKARELIEDQLIRNQQRISLDMNICYDYIGKPALDTLVSVHLLRAEPNTTGGTSYELAHDTLVAPILEARKVRLEKMEEERAEQERQKELRLAQEKAEHERMERDKERKRQRKILFIISVAAVVSIALGVFALIKMNQANALLNQLSEKQKQEQKLKYERFSSEAKSAQENGNFEKAIDLWQVTKEFTSDTLTINATIDSCKALIGKGKEFEEIVKQAKALVSESRYDAAIDAYKKALDLGVSNQTVINQLKDLKIEIDNQASEHRNRAEALKTFNPAGAATERNMAAKFENLSGRIVKLI